MGKHHNFLLLVWLTTLLSACGGSNNDTPTPPVEPVNQAPVANAGDDISVDEQTPVTLAGQGTDSDGTVASYLWQQTAGTQVTLTNTDKAQASFTAPDIKANETLTFSLTVTDNDGATHVDEVSIEVLHVNILPIAKAGEDIDADEETTITLSGAGNDEDGTITSYNWKQTAGTEAALKNADSSELAIALPDLPQDETLTFELTVTDNNGSTHTDTVDVKVKHLIWQTKSKNSGSLAELKAEFLDINSDDILDMLLEQSAEGNRTRIAWSKGKGDGSFEKPSTIVRFIDSVVDSYSVEDVDGNGTLDLLAGYYDKGQSNNYIVWRKIGETDPFSKPHLIYTSAYDENLDYKLANIDAKGEKDLVVATSNGIKWLQQTSDNRFADGVSITKNWSIKTSVLTAGDAILPSHGFSIADINGDMLPDLIMKALLPTYDTLIDSSVYIQASINQGEGAFSLPIALVSGHTEMTVLSSSGRTSYSLLDINNDGTQDVLVDLWYYENTAEKTTTKWFSFKGEQVRESFIFSPSRYESYPYSAVRSTQSDWDEDGISDFLLPIMQWSGENGFIIAFGQGNGNFAESVILENGQLSTGLFSVNLDLDLDGKKDFIGYREERHDNDDGTRSYKHFMFWHKKLVSNIESAQDLFEYKGKIKGTYDINNDGHIDFVSELDGTLYWYQNQSDLTFVEKTLISTD